ncbi:hypothetical protein EYF80_023819 [Liparis tanakae]|uniref:Uncharacterized protein n=1 Tax=Liparis tanakae TaxID=230148 RepID=A0A4Z2HJK6_9TELE|nr:hypothetical protein EYF80_023819 [Liparis tanakae]
MDQVKSQVLREQVSVTVPVQLAGRLCHLEMLRQSLQEGEVTVRQQQSTEDTQRSVEHGSLRRTRIAPQPTPTEGRAARTPAAAELHSSTH